MAKDVITLTKREAAVARAVALAFLTYGEGGTLTLTEIARIVAPDDERDVDLQFDLTGQFNDELAIAESLKEEVEGDRTMRARRHCVICGCDLGDDGTCPEGHPQNQGEYEEDQR